MTDRFSAPDPKQRERHPLMDADTLLSEADYWALTKLSERYGVACVLHDLARLSAYEEFSNE